MAKILILNGPNLNLLGKREPEIYGTTTLADIDKHCANIANDMGHELESRQSNSEPEIIEWVQRASSQKVDFIIINPAALTHTSVALRDAFSATKISFIEVHLSNPYAREPFRSQSYLRDIALGGIYGFGELSYYLALQAANQHLQK